MAGREGLVDTAVKTAETGYMQVTDTGVRLLSALQEEDVCYVHVEIRGGGEGLSLCVSLFNVAESNLSCETHDSAPVDMRFINQTSGNGTVTHLFETVPS